MAFSKSHIRHHGWASCQGKLPAVGSSQLLTPVLSWVAHYSSAIKTLSSARDGEFEYSSEFMFEPATEKRVDRRGRKPQVDYALCGHIGDGTIYQIAAEAKAKLVQSDIAQLAQYMSTLVNGTHLKGRATAGVLIRTQFSAFCASRMGKRPPSPLSSSHQQSIGGLAQLCPGGLHFTLPSTELLHRPYCSE